MDREKIINYAEETLSNVLPDEKDTSGIMVKVGWIREVLAMLKEQERIIKQYQKADGFLFAHGWKWENYIDTQDEPHPIEVGEDGLPY